MTEIYQHVPLGKMYQRVECNGTFSTQYTKPLRVKLGESENFNHSKSAIQIVCVCSCYYFIHCYYTQFFPDIHWKEFFSFFSDLFMRWYILTSMSHFSAWHINEVSSHFEIWISCLNTQWSLKCLSWFHFFPPNIVLESYRLKHYTGIHVFRCLIFEGKKENTSILITVQK